jgi:Fe-S-cluster-containing dehydrogenase component
VVPHEGLIYTWVGFWGAGRRALAKQQSKRGAGLRILTGTVTSPSLAAHLQAVRQRYPEARWHQYEPISRDGIREGTRQAFGRVQEPVYRFDQASVILSLDSNFFSDTPGSLRYAREFARRRKADAPGGMNRLYVVEPTPTITGTSADHRLPLRAGTIEAAARFLAQQLGASVASIPNNLSDDQKKWLATVGRDLGAHRGTGLVIAGPTQPAAVHAVVAAINQTLNNSGKTVLYSDPVEAQPVNQLESMRELVSDMKAGNVDMLLVLGGNPVFDVPADLEFAKAMEKVTFRAHLGLYDDETSARSSWHLPEAHALESWGDLRAYNGMVSVIQPLIEPLYGGKTALEILSAITEGSPRPAYDLVRDYWKKRSATVDFAAGWDKALHDGVVAGTALDARGVQLTANTIPHPASPLKGEGSGLEIVFRPDPTIWDGRYANNGWLQELPKPVSKLTWDNVAYIAPKLAEKLGLAQEDVVELNFNGRKVEAPVYILPGQAEDAVTVTLGYGRQRTGRVGKGAGFDAYALRTSDAMWFGSGLTIKNTGKRHRLSVTQGHYSLEGRNLYQAATLAEFKRQPNFAKENTKPPKPDETLFNYAMPEQSKEEQWGMGIDLNLCIGCNACVIACQAENNIPIVGKDQVAHGREMHWIRIDQYFQGDLDQPAVLSQPVTCMHCEEAPCEPVCPVGATVHSEDGLNQMVYNRCLGTRYCSNNCPYKVRRFNFLQYTNSVQGPLELLQNPDVTVRSRGVMEKCTYCVQRIQSARITANKEGRAIMDGEVIPACAQACPTQTISFGNLLDKKSNVVARKSDPRDYAMLADHGTRPRTTYQARITNPNPEMPA